MIMRYWDPERAGILQKTFFDPDSRRSHATRRLIPYIVAALLTACERPAPEAVSSANCVTGGRLRADLYGAIEGSLDWQATALRCEGMPRPAGEGARIRLAGSLGGADSAQDLAFILGLPALEPGATGTELETNVTLIEEGSGRFFATGGTERCWTDIEEQSPLGDSATEFRVRGVVYCVGPLTELGGTSHVSFPELEFTGRLTWTAPD